MKQNTKIITIALFYLFLSKTHIMPLNGQAIRQQFKVIRFNPKPATPLNVSAENQDCCFFLPALAEADNANTSQFKNDKHSFYQVYCQAFTNVVFKLQKSTSGQDYQDVATLNDNTYGINYPFGFFVTMYGENAICYTLDFAKILFEEGEADYRIKAVATPLIGSDPVLSYSFEFCLKTYTDDRANRTVRLEWYKSGNSGAIDDDTKKTDYGTLDLFNQIRLPSAMFGFDEGTFEREFVKYQNGNKIWTRDVQIEEYTLKVDPIPNYLHRFLRIDALQSDDIYITDFNLNNPTQHVNRKVIPNANYSAQWNTYTKNASVELKFQQAIQNLIHKRG